MIKSWSLWIMFEACRAYRNRTQIILKPVSQITDPLQVGLNFILLSGSASFVYTQGRKEQAVPVDKHPRVISIKHTKSIEQTGKDEGAYFSIFRDAA